MVFRSRTDSGEVQKSQAQGSRVPLVITIVVLAAVGSAYYMYYRQQAAYYTGRNLRLLSMLTAQVEGRVTMFSDFVGLKAESDNPNSVTKPGDLYYAPGLKFGQCTDELPGELPAKTAKIQMRRDVVEGSRGWKVRLQAYNDQKPAISCASVMLDDVARPVFTSDLGAAFDVVLVAREDGTVLYSVRPPPVSSTLLGVKDDWIDEAEELPPTAPLNSTAPAVPTTDTSSVASAPAPEAAATPAAMTERDSGAQLLITNLTALKRRKAGLFSDYEAITPASLTMATGQTTVSLGGTDYVLFTQPYSYSRRPAGVHGKSNEWIVCGLVSASRFRYDVFAVSTSVVLIAIAIVMLALCCWPYLRIALIHPSQQLAITDVVLIVVCTIVGAAVLTLALLDAFAYRGITQTADEQLREFGDAVNDGFARNVSRAMAVLSKAEELTRCDAVKAADLKLAVQKLPVSLMGNDAAGIYPYIDSIAWIGEDGLQKVRFGRALSPLKDVSNRSYFKLASQERTWTVPGYPPTPYVLEWVRSKATGDVRAILAKKTEESADCGVVAQPAGKRGSPFSVIAMATNLIDVSDAIPPPGAELAIIDEDGNVVYHSDTQRIGFENFFTDGSQSRAALGRRRAAGRARQRDLLGQ